MSEWRLERSDTNGEELLCLLEDGTALEKVLTEHVAEKYDNDKFPAMYLWDDVLATWPLSLFREAVEAASPALAAQLKEADDLERARYQEALDQGTIRYSNLARYFSQLFADDHPFIRDLYGARCLLRVNSYEYVGGLRPAFVVDGELHVYVGNGETVVVSIDTRIPPYRGTKSVEDLAAYAATDEEVREAQDRAARVQFLVDSGKPHKGSGSLLVPGPWQDQQFALQGSEVMSDPFGCAVEQGLYHTELLFELSGRDPLPEGDDHLISPLLSCFSFRYKRWGYVHVEDLNPVEFDTELFEKDLVIPHKHRMLLRAACHLDVKGHLPIEGKGEGAILLLSGPPGCGKTFTAETLSAALETPLYKLDMGELHVTDPSAMERQLRVILARAARWNATLLFDEADVFLAPRGADVMHKAMVTTFLRKLEYYTGIMILTTNLTSLDPAVMQRALVSIQYPSLQLAGRVKIWKRNLSRFGFEGDADQLATSLAHRYPDKNGRDIVKGLVLAARMMDLQSEKEGPQKEGSFLLALEAVLED